MFAALILLAISALAQQQPTSAPVFRRVVILKVDGLNEELLFHAMQQEDPETGKSSLPWFSHIFAEQGIIFRNFYVRGISLSAPSWSMLDTGQHTAIRGNVEYDRYTGQVYDYLNVFPFYIGYARGRAVDMPGVEVLDRAGIPLLIDRFHHDQILQSFQLFQRGVTWTTLKNALLRGFSGKSLFSMVESAAPISLSSSLSKEEASVLERGLRGPDLLYLDFFTGDADHEGHATSAPNTMSHVLRELDALLGQVWTAVQQGPLARQTLLVVVSDHGMNNVPGIISQTFSLPDFFNSPEGGAHHVITDREQLSDYKLKGINPLVHRVVTPSSSSFYLQGRASQYPTAWLDIDGNERTAVHLRNSDLNKIQILMLQLARSDLSPALRKAAAQSVNATIDRHRTQWSRTAADLADELSALEEAISERKKLVGSLPGRLSSEERDQGEDKIDKRPRRELNEWEHDASAYKAYGTHLRTLLAFRPDETRRFTGNIAELVPEMSLGDNNGVADLEHYIVGPSPAGLLAGEDGRLDEARSFRYVNYFPLLLQQKALNNPQPQLSSNPIDFTAMALPDGPYSTDAAAPQHAYWLYSGEDRQLLILQDGAGRLSLMAVCNLAQDESGRVKWTGQAWRSGLPLELFEDPQLDIPAQEDRGKWLSGWHTEAEWFSAIHKCRYSNGVIGITEELSPVGVNVPGPPGISPVLLRFEKRRRELVQADFHVFAADHWNFNVRFPNPGGNHGGFLRISTHSVWMMAGYGLAAKEIEQPYDSLNFASTVLNLLGRTPPMLDRVVDLR